MKKTIFLTIFFIFLFPIVFGNSNWFQEGNADANFPGGNGQILFASNYANAVTTLDNITYEKCTVDGSLYTPVATDFTGDGFNEFVVTTTNRIKIYDSDCSQVSQILATPRAMPVIMNFDNDADQEIVFITATSLEAWEFDSTTYFFNNTLNISTTDLEPLDFFGCARDQDKCVGFKTGSNDTLAFDLDLGTATLNSDVMISTPINTPTNSPRGYNGLAFTDTFLGTDVYTPFCFMKNLSVSPNAYICQLINIDGQDVGVIWDEAIGTLFGTNNLTHMSATIIKLGSAFRVFQSWTADTTGNPVSGWSVQDLQGTPIQSNSLQQATLEFGNSMIADFDKDGSNEMCNMRDLSPTRINFTCWASDFSQTNYDLSTGLGDTIDVTQGAVMADFNPESDYMCLANYEGIYCVNATNTSHLDKIFNTSLSWSQTSDSGFSITVGSAGVAHAYIYADSDETFIVRNTVVSFACGDGICQDFENSFTCSADCQIVEELEEGTCNSDADCVPTYPYCITGLCVASDNISQTCTFDSDCPYNNPFCYSGFCIKGWQTGVPDSENVTAQEQEVNDSIDGTMGILFGTSTLLKYIVALAIIIGITVTVAQNTKSDLAVLLTSIFATILVTILGLVPIYVLILIIISAVAIVTLKTFLFPSAGGG